tara:strand:+ start:85 stop:237 length:153 start_codon:yes stop_codon:yes gene_type:complete
MIKKISKKILTMCIALTLTACASIKDKLPEREACVDGAKKTISQVFCKKN